MVDVHARKCRMEENMEFLEPIPMEAPVSHTSVDKVFTFFIFSKGAEIFFYLFSWLFFSLPVVQWVLTLVSCAVEFWFTKNIAGRFILGLRWANRVNQDGESEWVFEGKPPGFEEQGKHSSLFWILLFASAGIWGLFSFMSLIKLNLGWFFVSSIGLALSASNAWGFTKCDQSMKQKFQAEASGFFSSSVLPFLFRGQL